MARKWRAITPPISDLVLADSVSRSYSRERDAFVESEESPFFKSEEEEIPATEGVILLVIVAFV